MKNDMQLVMGPPPSTKVSLIRWHQRLLLVVIPSFALVTVMGSTAEASEYGCKVLLCLSNPSGPMAEDECKPPIKQLYSDLSHKPPKPFPRCEEAKGQTGVTLGTSSFDPCPQGTATLDAGVKAVHVPKSSQANSLEYVWIGDYQITDPDHRKQIHIGIGEGEQVDSGYGAAQKVCVGKFLGTVSLVYRSGDAMVTEKVNTYEAISVLDRINGNPRYIDVEIQGQLHRRVRW
jgi:hypothetical protein